MTNASAAPPSGTINGPGRKLIVGQRYAAQSAVRQEPSASVRLVLAVVGSVCGALITGALDTSPTVTLIGAALGSAVPALVTFAGPAQALRTGVAIAVTGVALFITYGGFTLFDYATDRAETFPAPPGVAPPAPAQLDPVTPGEVTPGEGTTSEGTTGEGTPGEGTPGEGTLGEGTLGEGTPGEGTPDPSS